MPIYKTGKTKDGKAQYRVFVNYIDADGKYRKLSRTVYGAAEAKMEELRLLAETGNESKSKSKTITVQTLYDKYVEAKRSEIRQTSLEKLQSILSNHVLPYLADTRISDLTAKCLQEWRDIIGNKDIKVITKNKAYTELRALLNFAVRTDYLPKNPLDKIPRFRDAYFTHEKEKLHFYTPEQFKQFISVAEQYKGRSINDSGYYVFFNIAFYTGMRKGEINALKWSDIEGDIIHVRRSISQKTKNGDQETPPKNKSSYRSLQMPKKLVLILEQHRTLQKQIKGFSDDFRVCGGVSPLRDSSISNRNEVYSKEAGLPHIKIHGFRHSHASVLANAGVNIMEIARRLGHSDVKMTWQTYAHLYPREEERAVAVLDSI